MWGPVKENSRQLKPGIHGRVQGNWAVGFFFIYRITVRRKIFLRERHVSEVPDLLRVIGEFCLQKSDVIPLHYF